jgi:hypothetical protein
VRQNAEFVNAAEGGTHSYHWALNGQPGKQFFQKYGGADKSLARPGRKQATATEDFDARISYLLSQLEEY